VQGVLEDALVAMLHQPVSVFVAGRTDRGVHADGQVVHLDLVPSMVPERLRGRDTRRGSGRPVDTDRLAAALDAATPSSIAIHAVRQVSPTFHARFSATSRTYRFRLRDGVDPRIPRGSDGGALDVWGVAGTLDVPAMRTAARHLLGEHDFAAFCRRSGSRTTVRRVLAITLQRVPAQGQGRIDVRVHGSAFCHQQVRSIVGCLIDVGRGRREPGWLAVVLASADRSLAAPVAPPHGLTLERVSYGSGLPSAPPAGARRGLANRGPDAG
jgi:tRNA pseudouridine38-40 synthase